MSLESFRSFISKVSTDFTTVADVQAMQLVQPIWNRLSVPAEWEVFGVVWDVIIVVIRVRLLEMFVV